MLTNNLNYMPFMLVNLTKYIKSISVCAIVFFSSISLQVLAEEKGVEKDIIRIGSVLSLEGDIKDLGRAMKTGIEAAIKGEKIQGKSLDYIAVNDFYSPETTVKETKGLIEKGIFAFLGNTGTPTAKAILPLLADNRIPAVGFYTGSDILRPGIGDIVNFRASYTQEVISLAEAAIASGINPKNICAFVQNDSFGMAGLAGLKNVLQKQPGMSEVVKMLDQVINMSGEDPARNDIGPVGVYVRNTITAYEGYNSLKNWEKKSGAPCRLVVTVATPLPSANFIGYLRYKGEKWVISMVSASITRNFVDAIKSQRFTGLIATGVVPSLDSPLPVVDEARKKLQTQLNDVSLEGFIVGKMFLAIMRNIKGDITHSNFIKAVKGQVLDIGGLRLDFTTDNQGSDFVQIAAFNGEDFKPIMPQQIAEQFKQ